MFSLYNLIKGGGSSFLFIIPTIKVLFTSNLMFWKLSNIFLVISSVLCNAYKYNYGLLVFDYFMITMVSVSYINNININMLIGILFYLECIIKNDITMTKNIAFISSVSLIAINTYKYYPVLFTQYIASLIIGVISRYIRNLPAYINNNTIGLLLTSIWHICITNILFTASYTAID